MPNGMKRKTAGAGFGVFLYCFKELVSFVPHRPLTYLCFSCRHRLSSVFNLLIVASRLILFCLVVIGYHHFWGLSCFSLWLFD